MILALFAVACAVGAWWGLPGTDSWAADAISPRSCGLGAIALTYWPGRFHIYPPLHMLILTVLSLPWIGLAALRAGTANDALEHELVKPLYMTGIEVSARLVAAAMALGIGWSTMRLWSRVAGERAGIAAGAIVAANAVLLYYAHTGNLEVPYLFWVTLALVEIDRVACGEAREGRALLYATAAVLTKDQAAAAFLLTAPLYLVAIPYFARRASIVRRGLVRAVALSIVTYAVVSGALVNPVGFRRRVALLFGPASQSWTSYPRGLAGALAIGRDAVRAIPHFTAWPIAVAAVVGVALAWRGSSLDRVERARRLLPLVAALSFTLFFTLSARRTEDRFLLPQSVLFFPYAAIAFDRALEAWPRIKRITVAAAALALAPALLGLASMDATLLTDARYASERFLDALPAGTRIEVYGGSPFMPRIPPHLAAVRPGGEPLADRRAIAGVTELFDPQMDPRERAPAYIVLATELSSEDLAAPFDEARPPAVAYGVTSYRDPASRRMLRGLRDGSLGYTRVVRAACGLPPPLTCRRIHDSTAGEAWIYARAEAQKAAAK